MAQEQSNELAIALFYARHIYYPCTEPRTGQNLREFYLRLAEKAVIWMKNPFARGFLEDTIREYSIQK